MQIHLVRDIFESKLFTISDDIIELVLHFSMFGHINFRDNKAIDFSQRASLFIQLITDKQEVQKITQIVSEVSERDRQKSIDLEPTGKGQCTKATLNITTTTQTVES